MTEEQTACSIALGDKLVFERTFGEFEGSESTPAKLFVNGVPWDSDASRTISWVSGSQFVEIGCHGALRSFSVRCSERGRFPKDPAPAVPIRVTVGSVVRCVHTVGEFPFTLRIDDAVIPEVSELVWWANVGPLTNSFTEEKIRIATHGGCFDFVLEG